MTVFAREKEVIKGDAVIRTPVFSASETSS